MLVLEGKNQRPFPKFCSALEWLVLRFLRVAKGSGELLDGVSAGFGFGSGAQVLWKASIGHLEALEGLRSKQLAWALEDGAGCKRRF